MEQGLLYQTDNQPTARWSQGNLPAPTPWKCMHFPPAKWWATRVCDWLSRGKKLCNIKKNCVKDQNGHACAPGSRWSTPSTTAILGACSFFISTLEKFV